MYKKCIYAVALLFFLSGLLLPGTGFMQSKSQETYTALLKPILDVIKDSGALHTVTIGEDAVVQDNFVRMGDTITIDGDVDGDVIAAGNELIVNGTVTGDVIAAAETITLNGIIKGNVRIAGATVTINSKIGRNANLLILDQGTLTEEASVGWSLTFWARQLTIDAPVKQSIYGYGGDITLNSLVGTTVELFLDEDGSAVLEENASVSGNLDYQSDDSITVESGAKVQGDMVHHLTPEHILEARDFLTRAWFLFKIVSLFGALLVGTIIVSLFEKQSRALAGKLWRKPSVHLVWGVLLLLGAPPLLIFTAITLIGIPLSIIGFGIYLLFVYLTQIGIGIMIGTQLLERNKKESKKKALIWSMMLGTGIYFILVSLPYIGWLLSFVGTAWFLGTVAELLFRRTNKNISVKKDDSTQP